MLQLTKIKNTMKDLKPIDLAKELKKVTKINNIGEFF